MVVTDFQKHTNKEKSIFKNPKNIRADNNKTKSIEASREDRNEAFFLCLWRLTGGIIKSYE